MGWFNHQLVIFRPSRVTSPWLTTPPNSKTEFGDKPHHFNAPFLFRRFPAAGKKDTRWRRCMLWCKVGHYHGNPHPPFLRIMTPIFWGLKLSFLHGLLGSKGSRVKKTPLISGVKPIYFRLVVGGSLSLHFHATIGSLGLIL